MITNIILMIASILMLLYSAFFCHKLKREIDQKISQNSFLVILALIYIFVVGYSAFVCMLIGHSRLLKLEHLTTLIFFLGSLFVLLVIQLNGRLMEKLSHQAQELKTINHQLSLSNKEYIQKNEEQISISKKLKEKSQELENTMSDFYCLRMEMQEHSNDPSLIEENKNLKNKLDAIKDEVSVI